MALKKLAENWSLKLSASFPSREITYSQLSIDLCHEKKDQNNLFRLLLSGAENMYYFSSMQKITGRLAAGFGYVYMPTRRMALWSYGAQYTTKDRQQFFLQYSALQQSYILGYLHAMQKGTSLFSKYEVTPMGMGKDVKTTAVCGIRQRYETSEITIMANSRAKVSTMLSLTNSIITLKLCAIADFLKEKYKFGYGVTFGQ
jgi:mitochondrial import receptor subunit TOM40